MDSRIILNKLCRYRLAFGMGLNRLREQSQFHLASGFVLRSEDSLVMVTAGHQIRRYRLWVSEGIAEGFAIYHHSKQEEDRLVEYSYPVASLNDLIFDCKIDGIDVGIVTMNEDLLDSFVEHGVNFVNFPADLSVDEKTPSELSSYELVVSGFSVEGSKLKEASKLYLPGVGGFEEHSQLAVASLRSRFERIEKYVHESPGDPLSRLVLTPCDPMVDSLVGVSGGPLFLFQPEEEASPKIVGQQIGELADGNGGFECFFANSAARIIDGVNNCIAQRKLLSSR